MRQSLPAAISYCIRAQWPRGVMIMNNLYRPDQKGGMLCC